MVKNSAGPGRERRRHFRIDDEVEICLRPIVDEADLETVIEVLERRRPDPFTIAADFQTTSQEMNHLLRTGPAPSPQLVRYLKGIDQKLNQLARMVLRQCEAGAPQGLDEVNLSAGGVSLRAREAWPPGTLLEVRLILQPETIGVLAVGRVVECHVEDGDAAGSHRVQLEFAHIRETDRDLLVRHVLERQSEARRRARGEA